MTKGWIYVAMLWTGVLLFWMSRRAYLRLRTKYLCEGRRGYVDEYCMSWERYYENLDQGTKEIPPLLVAFPFVEMFAKKNFLRGLVGLVTLSPAYTFLFVGWKWVAVFSRWVSKGLLNWTMNVRGDSPWEALLALFCIVMLVAFLPLVYLVVGVLTDPLTRLYLFVSPLVVALNGMGLVWLFCNGQDLVDLVPWGIHDFCLFSTGYGVCVILLELTEALFDL